MDILGDTESTYTSIYILTQVVFMLLGLKQLIKNDLNFLSNHPRSSGGFNSSKKESEDEMQKLESENQTLMLKERVSKQELQDAHKEAFETASQICGGYFAVDFVDGFVRLHDIRTPDLLIYRLVSSFYQEKIKENIVKLKEENCESTTTMSPLRLLGRANISFPLRNISSGLTLEGGTPGAKIRSETLAEINVITDASGEGLKIRRYQRE
ncbi:hypothetical protein LguiB_026913 [Lonicera macranthoides]